MLMLCLWYVDQFSSSGSWPVYNLFIPSIIIDYWYNLNFHGLHLNFEINWFICYTFGDRISFIFYQFFYRRNDDCGKETIKSEVCGHCWSGNELFLAIFWCIDVNYFHCKELNRNYSPQSRVFNSLVQRTGSRRIASYVHFCIRVLKRHIFSLWEHILWKWLSMRENKYDCICKFQNLRMQGIEYGLYWILDKLINRAGLESCQITFIVYVYIFVAGCCFSRSFSRILCQHAIIIFLHLVF